MRKAQVGLFERLAIAEELARYFYCNMGYTVPEAAPRDYMQQSQHPQEQLCYVMALRAIRYFCKE